MAIDSDFECEEYSITIELPGKDGPTLEDLWWFMQGKEKPPPLKDNEYRCASCRGVFEKPWTDEESLAADGHRFTPEEMAGPLAVVCDDCWNEMDEGGALPQEAGEEPKGPNE